MSEELTKLIRLVEHLWPNTLIVSGPVVRTIRKATDAEKAAWGWQ